MKQEPAKMDLKARNTKQDVNPKKHDEEIYLDLNKDDKVDFPW